MRDGQRRVGLQGIASLVWLVSRRLAFAGLVGVVATTGIRLSTTTPPLPAAPAEIIQNVEDLGTQALDKAASPVSADGEVGCPPGQKDFRGECIADEPPLTLPTPTPTPFEEAAAPTPTPAAPVVKPEPVITPLSAQPQTGDVFLFCSRVARTDGGAGMAMGTVPHREGTVFEVHGCGRVVVDTE